MPHQTTYQHDACYQLVVYVPKTHVDSVKEALWNEGAGRLGNYERCSWQTLGEGSFRPLPGSQPSIGTLALDTCVEEWRVEMLCLGQYLTCAIEALKLAHPYETPAYSILQTL